MGPGKSKGNRSRRLRQSAENEEQPDDKKQDHEAENDADGAAENEYDGRHDHNDRDQDGQTRHVRPPGRPKAPDGMKPS